MNILYFDSEFVWRIVIINYIYYGYDVTYEVEARSPTDSAR